MKILLDTCVWGGAGAELEAAGHDVVWTGDWDKDPGDDEILGYAHNEQRILVTLDKDFGQLTALRGDTVLIIASALVVSYILCLCLRV